MDLRNLDTRERAHQGVEVPLVIDGERQLGLDGKPILFKLKGTADPLVRKTFQSAFKDAKSLEDYEEGNRKVLRVAVVGWSGNWMLDDEAVPFSKEALEKILEIPPIVAALSVEVGKQAHFMKKG